jgi:hypothetical protein
VNGQRIYFAPAGTEPPTMADLVGSGWQPVGQVEDDVTVADIQPHMDAVASYSAHLSQVYRIPEPYRPNRADRRAAARQSKQVTS